MQSISGNVGSDLAVPFAYLFTHLRHDHSQIDGEQSGKFNRKPAMIREKYYYFARELSRSLPHLLKVIGRLHK